MNLTEACSNILSQLAYLVEQIREDDFVKPAETLSHSTIGQHLRHTLEFFMCFEHGFDEGLINYDKRAHDKLIESDKYLALATIERISDFVNNVCDKSLKLEVGYDLKNESFVTIDTTATRELVYNIEHAVHHMAIMKIGIKEIAPYIQLAPDFGIAASTIRYKENSVTTSN
ncbi:DinB family protein [Chryseolinea sp. H1M3-3]|uniref:DinB family protein n=1 Tax=Chryseolinea sp. H1M3-3 TaxID=3034144 RepID=UPI0023EACE12|nr:DinB family protein [Chryseolinea sp. H1M3-3]